MWRALHPDHVKVHAQRNRAWVKAHPKYWRRYRRNHAAYYRQDLLRRRRAYKAMRSSANEIAIAEISRRKLKALEALQDQDSSANETSIPRRIELVVDYLVWRARSANEIAMAAEAGGGE